MGCRCFHCGMKDIPDGKEILLGQDGDFVCSERCKRGYETEKQHFFDNIVDDPQKTEDWLMGKI